MPRRSAEHGRDDRGEPAREGRRPELYNLKEDPAETKNFAATNAAKVKELTDLLQEVQKKPTSRE